MNYETRINGDHIGNVFLRCHDSERSNSFGVSNKFNIADGGYARVTFTEKLVLKDTAKLELLVDDEDQLLAYGSGNTLPVDRSYRHLSGISIQMKSKAKRKVCC